MPGADFEKLGAFYLGRQHDPATRRTGDELVLYDSADLVTHALIVGMTGSGKTGLGIALVEEAALDGVPSLVIDPKGDLTNLLMTFPSLAPAEFEPWVVEEDWTRAGSSRQAYAATEAERWQKGLAGWGEDAGRVRRLRDAAVFTIYTPGSRIGTPVSVLNSFVPPRSDDGEARSDRVQTVVSGLLALVGIDADPLRSREHILLSTVLADAWRKGVSLDLAALVHGVQQPPTARIGVLDVDAFYPPKDRFELAMAINALLAAPGFDAWTEGASLDVEALLRTETGKPRVSIFTLAHLDDRERMFFVTQLLSAVTSWMREQRGTASLRALLYMDEIAGFFPPVANPASKPPLLTLLKQGRAAGLGVTLATQNPVDLDYRGLANIGTWFLGRLQTERDKARLLDGLESAHGGSRVDRDDTDRMLSGLSPRVFLMRNVHEPGLTVFETRWTLSYLRGPLSRDEIRRLAGDRGPPVRAPGRRDEGAVAREASQGVAADRPVVPPDVPQFHVPSDGAPGAPWRPVLYGAAQVTFSDRSLKLNETRLVVLTAAIGDGAVAINWDDAAPSAVAPTDLAAGSPGDGLFEVLPSAATKPRNYPAWSKQLADHLVSAEVLTLFRSPSTGDVSLAGESERDFRTRVQQSAREVRDRAVEALRKKFAPRQAKLAEKLRRAEQVLEREAQQASSQRLQTAISFGATLLGAVLGRKAASVGTVGRATTAARGVGRSMSEAQDVERARETVAAVGEEVRRLDEEFAAATEAVVSPTDVLGETLETVTVPLKKSNVQVQVVALVWLTPPTA